MAQLSDDSDARHSSAPLHACWCSRPARRLLRCPASCLCSAASNALQPPSACWLCVALLLLALPTLLLLALPCMLPLAALPLLLLPLLQPCRGHGRLLPNVITRFSTLPGCGTIMLATKHADARLRLRTATNSSTAGQGCIHAICMLPAHVHAHMRWQPLAPPHHRQQHALPPPRHAHLTAGRKRATWLTALGVVTRSTASSEKAAGPGATLALSVR